MKNVIIIGKNYSSVLGLARSLGEAGYGVRLVALTKYTADIAAKSKYINKTISVDFDFFEESAAEDEIKALEELRGKDGKTLIIPCRDITCLMLERHWERLSDSFYFPNINGIKGELAKFSDKNEQKKLAAESGILTAPGKVYSTDEQGISLAVSEAVFPCFMKPLSSSWAKSEKKYVLSCNSAEELRKNMEKAASEGQCAKILIEKNLEIEKEFSVYGAAIGSNVYIPAVVETVRGGLGTHMGVAAEGKVISSAFLGDLKGKLENFVKKSGFTGLFCIDLAKCKGGIYFLEMNIRMGGSQYGVTMAGANLPAVISDIVYNGSTSRNVDIKEEVHFASELIDIDNYLKGLISLRQLFKYLSGEKKYFIKNKEDPQPWKSLRKFLAKRIFVLFAKKILRRK